MTSINETQNRSALADTLLSTGPKKLPCADLVDEVTTIRSRESRRSTIFMEMNRSFPSLPRGPLSSNVISASRRVPRTFKATPPVSGVDAISHHDAAPHNSGTRHR